ncbi:GumC family protein [Cognatilysobacter lacus]|uniref:Polysaccharide biosynthesis tyrosine autokinase n=1 Tax=Cognatilysobacter lacus TaxID=1643323 RepID=A0A5D8ZAT4_9GAMM|nr:polysaccharide biosynthesis tyrosine autokinase [Lysobacter lacus]TZF91232.1 polysaccharide biosynthesis tyrosine autokinase [Lysobacter lacus]
MRKDLAMDLAPRSGEFDLLSYWKVVRERRWTILGIAGVIVAVVLVATLLTKPTYRASSTLQIERETIKVVNSDALASADSPYDRDFYQTQFELLKSRSLALRVIQDLNLINDPYFSGGAKPKAPGGPRAAPAAGDIRQREQALIGAVQGGLTIEPVSNSRLVRISFDAADAGLAARVANAYADAFIASNIERRFGASAYAKKYLEERLAELKGRLADSEKQLVGFAEKQQIISVGEGEPSLSAQNLSALNALLAKAQDERIRAEAQWRQANAGSGMGMPEVVDNALIQSLRQSRATLAGQYQEKSASFKADYPEMVQLKGQIAELDRQIATEVNNIRSSVNSRYGAAKAQEDLLARRIQLLKGDVLDLANRSIQYNILKRETATNQQIYDALLQRYKEIGVAGGIGANNISIVDRAEVPGGPYKPNLRRNVAFALIFGLVLGTLAAFLLKFLDRRIRSSKALEALTGRPVLGIIPKLEAGTTPAQASANARSPFSESYRSVRTALQFATPHGLPRTLLVTSPGSSEGKSTSAAELAHNIAQLGRRVVLIDADLRNPSLHKALGRSNAVGLSNVLAGAAEVSAALQDVEGAGFALITSGPLPPNPPELLGGDGLIRLLEQLSAQFEIVIIDGPPVLGLADAPLLASRAEATLLVVMADVTRSDAVHGALQRLSATHGNVLGTLFTRWDMRGDGEYGYGGYGYYQYGASDR